MGNTPFKPAFQNKYTMLLRSARWGVCITNKKEIDHQIQTLLDEYFNEKTSEKLFLERAL